MMCRFRDYSSVMPTKTLSTGTRLVGLEKEVVNRKAEEMIDEMLIENIGE